MANEPLISIVVPMYNSEKYISECLESIIGQTFKDFEVIIVDDCSTDNSLAIVEDYVQKFADIGQELKILKRTENSGYGSIPRNEGLEIARGKYVYFVDSDDLISEDALENLYDVAEKSQAEVLICKKHLISLGEGEEAFKNLSLSGDRNDNNIELVPNDLPLRLKAWMKNYFPQSPWKKFIRRDFLIENNIKFLNIMQEDSIWTFEIICLAEKIVMTPHVCYIYRKHKNSVCDDAFSTSINPDIIYKKFDRVMHGLNYLDEFMGRLEFFKQSSEIRYMIIQRILEQNLMWIYTSYKDAEPFQIYESIRKAIENESEKTDIVISSLVGFSFNLIKMLEKNQNNLNADKFKF